MLNLNLLAESHGAACVDASPEGPWIDVEGHSVRTLSEPCAVCGFALTPSNPHDECVCPPDAADIIRALDKAYDFRPPRHGRVVMWFKEKDGTLARVECEGVSATDAIREYLRRDQRRAIARAGRAS